MLEVLAGCASVARDARAPPTDRSAAADVAAAAADALHAHLLDAPAAAAVATVHGFDPTLTAAAVSAVPALHIGADFAGPATSSPRHGALACALATALASTYPTPSTLDGGRAALARASAAADAGDADGVATALAGAGRAAAGLPALAPEVTALAQTVSDAVAAARGADGVRLAAAAARAVADVAAARVTPGAAGGRRGGVW